MFRIFFSALILVFATATPAFAHDCWLQPDHFRLGLEMLLAARIFVGERLKSDKELPLDKKITPRLDLFTRKGRQDLVPRLLDQGLPAISFMPEFQGSGLLAMDRDFTAITLETDKFTSYLAHEHHLHLLDQVEANSRSSQKEAYARCMKALVQVDNFQDEPELWAQRTGQKLEIILLSPPKSQKPVRVQVLFEGRPLADKTVTAVNAGPNAQTDQTMTTDHNGMAEFENSRAGLWLIRLVHLYPCREEKDMDWTSYWASFCFEIPEP